MRLEEPSRRILVEPLTASPPALVAPEPDPKAPQPPVPAPPPRPLP